MKTFLLRKMERRAGAFDQKSSNPVSTIFIRSLSVPRTLLGSLGSFGGGSRDPSLHKSEEEEEEKTKEKEREKERCRYLSFGIEKGGVQTFSDDIEIDVGMYDNSNDSSSSSSSRSLAAIGSQSEISSSTPRCDVGPHQVSLFSSSSSTDFSPSKPKIHIIDIELSISCLCTMYYNSEGVYQDKFAKLIIRRLNIDTSNENGSLYTIIDSCDINFGEIYNNSSATSLVEYTCRSQFGRINVGISMVAAKPKTATPSTSIITSFTENDYAIQLLSPPLSLSSISRSIDYLQSSSDDRIKGIDSCSPSTPGVIITNVTQFESESDSEEQTAVDITTIRRCDIQTSSRGSGEDLEIDSKAIEEVTDNDNDVDEAQDTLKDADDDATVNAVDASDNDVSREVDDESGKHDFSSGLVDESTDRHALSGELSGNALDLLPLDNRLASSTGIAGDENEEEEGGGGGGGEIGDCQNGHNLRSSQTVTTAPICEDCIDISPQFVKKSPHRETTRGRLTTGTATSSTSFADQLQLQNDDDNNSDFSVNKIASSPSFFTFSSIHDLGGGEGNGHNANAKSPIKNSMFDLRLRGFESKTLTPKRKIKTKSLAILSKSNKTFAHMGKSISACLGGSTEMTRTSTNETCDALEDNDDTIYFGLLPLLSPLLTSAMSTTTGLILVSSPEAKIDIHNYSSQGLNEVDLATTPPPPSILISSKNKSPDLVADPYAPVPSSFSNIDTPILSTSDGSKEVFLQSENQRLQAELDTFKHSNMESSLPMVKSYDEIKTYECRSAQTDDSDSSSVSNINTNCTSSGGEGIGGVGGVDVDDGRNEFLAKTNDKFLVKKTQELNDLVLELSTALKYSATDLVNSAMKRAEVEKINHNLMEELINSKNKLEEYTEKITTLERQIFGWPQAVENTDKPCDTALNAASINSVVSKAV